MDLNKNDKSDAEGDETDEDDGFFVDTLKDMPTKNNSQKNLSARVQDQSRIDTAKIAVIHEALQKGIEIDPKENPQLAYIQQELMHLYP